MNPELTPMPLLIASLGSAIIIGGLGLGVVCWGSVAQPDNTAIRQINNRSLIFIISTNGYEVFVGQLK